MPIEIDEVTLNFLKSKRDFPLEKNIHILIKVETDKDVNVFVFDGMSFYVQDGTLAVIRLVSRENTLTTKKRVDFRNEMFYGNKIPHCAYEIDPMPRLVAPIAVYDKCKISLYVDDYV